MIGAYNHLHHLGYAHSFEVWSEDQLIGGLYGLSLGKAFFGESMFHQYPMLRKLPCTHLCQTLRAWHFDFIDCQMPAPHLIN